MTDEYKTLTIGDLWRIAERCKAGGFAAIPEHVGQVLIGGDVNWDGHSPQFIDIVRRIAHGILAERTSSEALKRAARVEELAEKATPGPWATWAQQPDVQVQHADGKRIADVDTWDGKGCLDADFIAETRTLAPALAADVRAYDAALRDLVDAGAMLLEYDSLDDSFESKQRFDCAIDAAKKVLNG